MTKRVRFWVYTTSPVRITLDAGQTLHHSSGGRTDEGWHRESNIWSFDGKVVTSEWCTDGRDCDGRLTRSGEAWFAADKAQAGYVEEGDSSIRYPSWEHGNTRQRDEYAEMAGY